MYSDADCTSSNFVYGSALGLRVFSLDSRGILRGVTYPQAWHPGENIAKCLVARLDGSEADLQEGYFYQVAGIGIDDTMEAVPRVMAGYAAKGCGNGNLDSAMDAACSCGFYAYHSKNAVGYSTRHGARVLALIEGYGKVVVGALGFRAQKARIVAIVPPTPHEASQRRRDMERAISDIDEVLHEDAEKPALTQGTAIVAGLGLATSVLAPLFGGALLVGAGYNHFATARTREYARNQLELQRKKMVREYDAMPNDYVETMARFRENYPEVEMHDTAAEMLGKRPLVSLTHLVRPEDNIVRGDS